ncbi:MAG: hypothetical protein V1754_10900 [Pseudomonadota bacterium]
MPRVCCILIPQFETRLARQIRAEILEALYQLAPIVGHNEQDAFFLSLDGLEKLHPDEQQLGKKIHEAISAFHSPLFVAIADNPTTAWIVVRASIAELVIVPPGKDRIFLASLPTDALPIPKRISELCSILGLDKVAALQRLPKGTLIHRFGKIGAELEQRIHARTNDSFQVEIPPIIEEAESHLEHPTDDLDALFFVHKKVLDQLICQVVANHRFIAALELRLALTVCDEHGNNVVFQQFRPAVPTVNGRIFLELITLWLTSAPLHAAVDAIQMRAIEICSTTNKRQLRLFSRTEDLAAETLAKSIARLSAALGEHAVVRPSLKNRHLPEARLEWTPIKDMDLTTFDKQQPNVHHITFPVLRLIDPPIPARLKPPEFQQAKWLCIGAQYKRIVQRNGLYPLSGEWWEQGGGFCRHYMIITTEDGEVHWIYQDGDAFFLHAFLD